MDTFMEYYKPIDAIVSHYTYQIFDLVGWDLRPTTYVTENWWAVSSPTPCVLLLIKYGIVVGTSYLYQSMFPKEKKPDGPVLKTFILLHNAFLALLSLWMGSSMVYYWYTTFFQIAAVAYDPIRDANMAWVIYIFYLSKFYEFLDTYIMLIKGNLKQVSFLHVYHHFSTALIFWMVSKSSPGGDAYFCVTLNCWVHVVMYTYYFLTAIITTPESRKRYLWWGKYLTQFQLTQFVLNLFHAFYCFYYSPFWWIGKYLQTIDMVVLLFFFGDFYLKKYRTPVKKIDVKKTN